MLPLLEDMYLKGDARVRQGPRHLERMLHRESAAVAQRKVGGVFSVTCRAGLTSSKSAAPGSSVPRKALSEARKNIWFMGSRLASDSRLYT